MVRSGCQIKCTVSSREVERARGLAPHAPRAVKVEGCASGRAVRGVAHTHREPAERAKSNGGLVGTHAKGQTCCLARHRRGSSSGGAPHVAAPCPPHSPAADAAAGASHPVGANLASWEWTHRYEVLAALHGGWLALQAVEPRQGHGGGERSRGEGRCRAPGEPEQPPPSAPSTGPKTWDFLADTTHAAAPACSRGRALQRSPGGRPGCRPSWPRSGRSRGRRKWRGSRCCCSCGLRVEGRGGQVECGGGAVRMCLLAPPRLCQAAEVWSLPQAALRSTCPLPPPAEAAGGWLKKAALLRCFEAPSAQAPGGQV